MENEEASMPKRKTPSYAKNIIRNTLREIVDPVPSEGEILDLWETFGSKCAYCNRPLEQGARQGHIDHLVSTIADGTNHISNRVLACSRCNGDEKRDQNWIEFLRLKAVDSKSIQSPPQAH
jgi:5-methylcytosine-specific restriction endonuclease McrA